MKKKNCLSISQKKEYLSIKAFKRIDGFGNITIKNVLDFEFFKEISMFCLKPSKQNQCSQ
jgi:hypothetical protein